MLPPLVTVGRASVWQVVGRVEVGVVCFAAASEPLGLVTPLAGLSLVPPTLDAGSPEQGAVVSGERWEPPLPAG